MKTQNMLTKTKAWFVTFADFHYANAPLWQILSSQHGHPRQMELGRGTHNWLSGATWSTPLLFCSLPTPLYIASIFNSALMIHFHWAICFLSEFWLIRPSEMLCLVDLNMWSDRGPSTQKQFLLDQLQPRFFYK